MSATGGWATPGLSAERTTTETEIMWGADQARNAALWQSKVVSGAARDTGNTSFTHVLRPGLLMGKLTSGGKLMQWDSTATDGSQDLAGILDTELRATDFDAANADRVFRMLVARGPVKASKLLIKGAAFVGHADEFVARRMLAAGHFILDDDPFGYLAGSVERILAKAADYTVTTADNGTIFTNTGAAALINFTLPAIKKGLQFSFYSTDNDGIKITAGTADTIVTANDAAADSVALSTTARNIGGKLSVRANEDGTLWLCSANVWATDDAGATVTKATIVT